MKTFTYENQGQETLLVYHLDEEEHLDSFAKGMLQSNEIVGILRPSFVCRDGDCYLKYPVTSKIPLVDYVQKEMSRTAVLGFCQSFVCAVQEIEEYMLPKEKLLLDVDFIFVDIARKEASLVYLPIDEFTSSCSMKEFLLTFLSHLRFCMDQDVSYVAKLIHFINQTKGWSFEELRRFLTEQMEERDLRLQQNFIQSDLPQMTVIPWKVRSRMDLGEKRYRKRACCMGICWRKVYWQKANDPKHYQVEVLCQNLSSLTAFLLGNRGDKVSKEAVCSRKFPSQTV